MLVNNDDYFRKQVHLTVVKSKKQANIDIASDFYM
jgi:hypothetical protein